MTRGNWQKRVETAEARKNCAKQKKVRSEEKRLCKIWFQELLQQFDRYNDIVLTSVKKKNSVLLHLWTDTVPSLSEHLVDLLGDEHVSVTTSASNKRRGDKGRPRSDSNVDNNSNNRGKKKAHPRSKSAGSTEEMEPAHQLLLCREAFLKGPAPGTLGSCCTKGKKSTCRYIHYSPRFKTLGAIVGESIDSNQWETIEEKVIDATSQDMLDNQPGAMEFLFYTCISLPRADASDEALSQFIAEKLVQNDTPASSVHYAALDGILVFDRLRGGVLLQEREFVSIIGQKPPLDRRTSSVGSQGEEDTTTLQVFQDLPSTILEHILLFLPDITVGATAQVCRAWNSEIGKHSPNLWRELLQRRNWPVPSTSSMTRQKESNTTENDTTITTMDERGMFRAVFLEHYSILRDVRALAAATGAIVSRQPVPEIEVAFQDYARRKYAPTCGDRCVSVNGWSDRLLLAGYSKDCTLRLFEATGFAEKTGELRCKELVCQSVSPYQNTKKRNCRLTAVEIDELNIGCLCEISSDKVVNREADVLVIVGREDFLLGTSSEAHQKGGTIQPDSMKVIDIGESVLNFLLTAEVADHRLLPLFDYLHDGGEIGDIDVRASEGSLCACGYGRFLVEVAISIPDLNTEDETEMIQLDRKLMLFSSNFNAIVWMGESYAPRLEAAQPGEKVNLTLFRRRHTECFIASKSCRSPDILLTEIDARGIVQPSHLLASPRIRPTIIEENYDFIDTEGLEVTCSEVITVEVKVNRINEELNDVKSVLVFFPRYPGAHQAAFDLVSLPRGYLVKSLQCFSDRYIIAFCHFIKPIDERTLDVEGLEGQWFSESNNSEQSRTIAVIVSIESRCAVGEVDFPTEEELRFGSFGSGTVGLAIGSRGIAITGSIPRSMRQNSPCISTTGIVTSLNKQKKKSNKGKRGGKKDGFARGMSLRG